MKNLRPFQLVKTANAGVATRISATPRSVHSAQITAKTGNAGAILIGTLNEQGAADPKTEIPLILPIVDGLVYDLHDLYFLTANNGDGIDVFGFE